VSAIYDYSYNQHTPTTQQLTEITANVTDVLTTVAHEENECK